jgi:hypothetical protein
MEMLSLAVSAAQSSYISLLVSTIIALVHVLLDGALVASVG